MTFDELLDQVREFVREREAELHRLRGELTLAKSKVQGLKSKVTDPQPLIPEAKPKRVF